MYVPVSSAGHPTIISGEVSVRESQTVLRISVLRCLSATNFFTKTFPKRFVTRAVDPYVCGRDIFAIFGT